MDFLKKRLSMHSDPDKDKEEKTQEPNKPNKLLESFSNKRASLWNDFTSKMNKSDKTTPEGSENDFVTIEASNTNTKTKPSLNGLAFMETVKQKLQSVRLYENGDTDSDAENDRLRGEPECAPLIDTADNSEAGDSAHSDNATCGEESDAAVQITVNGEETGAAARRKKLGKRQDSFTAEEVYLDTVAAQVRCGLVKPDAETALVSPSKAVAEFSFANKDKSRTQVKKKSNKTPSSNKNTLAVSNGNLINFDSIQNLSQAASSVAETIVHHEDDGVFDYESSG